MAPEFFQAPLVSFNLTVVTLSWEITEGKGKGSNVA